MAILYLVRHGQASFGADDYDKLSEAGWQQARWLGEYFAQRGLQFSHTIRGSLRRHDETLQGIVDGMGSPTMPLTVVPGLNEFDSAPILQAKLGHVELKSLAHDKRAYFQVLRNALLEWAEHKLIPEGEHSYAVFRARVLEALDTVCAMPSKEPVLVVSSGGPISTILGHLLQVPRAITIDLNLQTRNASFAELAYNASSRRVVSFNNIPHLDTQERAGLITYA